MPKGARFGRLLAWTLASAVVLMAVPWPVANHLVTGTGAAHAASPLPVWGPQGDAVRPFSVVARRYDFSPDRLEVVEGDVVKVTLEAADIPHSFTVDAYRISKRATPGHPTAFEFRADTVGEFPFYCNLQVDDGCRRMKGTLVVRPRPR